MDWFIRRVGEKKLGVLYLNYGSQNEEPLSCSAVLVARRSINGASSA